MSLRRGPRSPFSGGRRGAPSGAGRLALAAALALSVLSPPRIAADADQDRRIEAGLKIFRALLAADDGLKERADPEGRLLILFFYTDDRRKAEEDARGFGRLELPTILEPASDPTLAAYAGRVPAAIFIAQAPDARALRAIVKFGIDHRVVVYSPFEGHVESGVLGGLSIEAQVRPYLNLTTLRESNIRVRDFFLKVAKVYR